MDSLLPQRGFFKSCSGIIGKRRQAVAWNILLDQLLLQLYMVGIHGEAKVSQQPGSRKSRNNLCAL